MIFGIHSQGSLWIVYRLLGAILDRCELFIPITGQETELVRRTQPEALMDKQFKLGNFLCQYLVVFAKRKMLHILDSHVIFGGQELEVLRIHCIFLEEANPEHEIEDIAHTVHQFLRGRVPFLCECFSDDGVLDDVGLSVDQCEDTGLFEGVEFLGELAQDQLFGLVVQHSDHQRIGPLRQNIVDAREVQVLHILVFQQTHNFAKRLGSGLGVRIYWKRPPLPFGA